MKKLAKKVKAISISDRPHDHKCLLIKDNNEEDEEEASYSPTTTKTPTGTFVVYVGKDRQRFVVPTGYLSHPLFKILLNKAYNEFGFQQESGLVVPCSVTAFQDVTNAVECCNKNFNFGDLVEEFL